jgi:hypothetical protein
MAVDQVVDMVSVRYGLVPTGWAMLVALWMSAAIVARCAAVGICGRHCDDMLIEMTLVRMMKMAVVEIVHMAIMSNGRVAATPTMFVRMVVMDLVRSHCRLSFQSFSPAWAMAISTRVRT